MTILAHGQGSAEGVPCAKTREELLTPRLQKSKKPEKEVLEETQPLSVVTRIGAE